MCPANCVCYLSSLVSTAVAHTSVRSPGQGHGPRGSGSVQPAICDGRQSTGERGRAGRGERRGEICVFIIGQLKGSLVECDMPAIARCLLCSSITRQNTQVIAKWVAENDSEHILRVLKEARVPAGPILSIADIAKEEQYQQRGMFERVTPPGSADDSGKLVVRCACVCVCCSSVCRILRARARLACVQNSLPPTHSNLKLQWSCRQWLRCSPAPPASRAGRGRRWANTPMPFSGTSWA